MPPRRILLTGAGGFVGLHLAPVLRREFPGAELIPLGAGAPNIDITDAEAVQALVRRTRPEACVHLAAVAAVSAARGDPDLAWRVNLHGTLALAGAIRAHAPGCTLLHVSSAEVYGDSFRSGMQLDEAALPAPLNTYAATKAAADLALGAMAADGLKLIRVRPFNHTGPGQSADYAVPAFARQIARIAAGVQPAVMRVGDLEPRRDFLDVRDVCSAYAACLRHAEALPQGRIFNIASGVPRRIGDILAELLALAGVTVTVQADTVLLRHASIPTACGDAAAAAGLGWSPVIPWSQTLREVLEDWKARVAAEPSL